ncbi:hypothetical protein Ais01nite_60460 [Asanoa ishikariensis]|uniref:HEAT repeat-containing protein n=1 Tax=Asanoa ishikariensis TaxID=137265 RepID=A0A1H3PA09_9ACTN|nr:hypothetical protein [Asanoa ishikariensis]GIF68011.1 hypothetical protein Ais01nite_60460 [Asanoa ishikariensis]SDY97655.1 hypothetical protein SAMN05421684_2682 [Asanoa ishikariensis]
MSLRERLNDPDDAARLAAVRRASTSGEVGLFEDLLDLALHDSSEVRTEGGMAEVYEHVGDAAAEALGRILRRRSELDPRVRAAVTDLANDDDRVATLLYYLGGPYEPLRRELAASTEGRLRLRAARAVLSGHRPEELTSALLVDPDPAVRVEGLRGPRPDRDLCLRLLRDDPAPEVRLVAARALRFAPHVGSGPFIAAADVERDPAARAMLLSCLARRRHDRDNRVALVGFLGEPAGYLRRDAAQALTDVDDPEVAAAIGLRMLVEPDDAALSGLLAHKKLLAHVPELREPLLRWRRHPLNDGERWSLDRALAAPESPVPPAGPDPADTDRLLREVLRWAVAALEPVVAAAYDNGESDALDLVRHWLAGGHDDLLRRALDGEENLWHTDPHAIKIGAAWDCAGAALARDLDWARRVGLAAAAEQGRRDPAAVAIDPERGPIVAARRAVSLTGVVHRLLADLVRAGVDAPPPGPLLQLVRAGEDLVEEVRETLPPDAWPRLLRLAMRPAEEAAYRAALAAAVPGNALPEDPDLPETVERRIVDRARRAARAWLRALTDDDRAPLSFAPGPDGPRPRFVPGRAWPYALDRAVVWLRDGRPTGPVRRGPADDLLRRLAALPYGQATDLEQLFGLIAATRAADWHRDLARAVLAGDPPARTDPLGPDLRDPGRPLDRPWPSGLVARMSDGQVVALMPGRPTPVSGRAWPERAGRAARCGACGGDVPVEGAVGWSHVDDDSYGPIEQWFAGTLAGTCPACGTRAEVPARLVLTPDPALSWALPPGLP